MAEEVATIPTVDIDVLAGKRDAPHLEAILFADYAATTQDGKAIVAGVFDRIFADPEERATGRFYVYVRTVEALEAPIEIKIVDPKGRVVATGRASVGDTVDLAAVHLPRAVSAVFPMGLQLGPEGVDGLYWFEVLYKGQSLGGGVLGVEFRKKGN